MTLIIILFGISLFLIFCMVDYFVAFDSKECQHKSIATYESIGFRQCIDCLEKFKLKGK